MLDWFGCYDERWQGILVPEAMAHPAKFSCGLISLLYDYGMEREWWKKGDLIGDPFGGVACGGVIAAYKGLRWLGVELEDKFVKLGHANIAKHRRTWEALGDPVPVLLQGDSRRFHEIVSVAAIDWEEVLVVRKP